MMFFAAFRQQLASPKLSWQLCLLAIIGGFAAAMLIVLFTFTIKAIQHLYLTTADNYTSLDALSRFDLPIVGALVILFFSWLTGYKYQRTGIPFVLHRLKVAYGAIPFRNTLHQFIGGAVSLSTGFSVGKEGPVVHLGAAASSFVGTHLKLPNNSIRTLCACGIAAGIAASFNTPIAAVLFVMEVILREYDIQMFIPIMLAAIIGSMVTTNIFGQARDYEFISQIMLNHQDFLILILLGIMIGALASLFNKIITRTIKRFEKFHIFTRLMIAALITGCLGFMIPHAMGTGSSAVSFAVEHHNQLLFIFSLLAAKFLMTVLVIGLGMPGGIVGPIIGIGAVSGILGSLLLGFVIPGDYVGSDFALIGMAGFMAATLNAPLAALLTVVELSNQLEIMLPAMIVIASSCLISGQLFKNKSVFTMQLDIQNLVYRKPPIETALQKVGVLSQINRNITLCEQIPNSETLLNATDKQPLILKSEENNVVSYHWLETEVKTLDPMNPPYCQHKLIPLYSQATLAEAYLLLLHQRNGGVYIHDQNSNKFLGIITFEQIKSYLLSG
jgi:chloride channel protein, CIC family